MTQYPVYYSYTIEFIQDLKLEGTPVLGKESGGLKAAVGPRQSLRGGPGSSWILKIL